MTLCVVVPVKWLRDAKSRLSRALSGEARESLVLYMLERVLEAARKCRVVEDVVVVSPDDRVLRAAHGKGARCLRDEGKGLNRAVELALNWCVERGYDKALVVLSDTPLITPADIEAMDSAARAPPTVVIAPSRDCGTNCMLLYPPCAIKPSYGTGSFLRHIKQARALGVRVEVYLSRNTMFDVDSPEDLALLLRILGVGACSRGIEEVLRRLFSRSL